MSHTQKQLRKYKQINALIATAQTRFMSMEFVKKDGSLRSMTFNPYGGAKHVKGESASLSAQQGTITRRTNNPNLLNVWAVDAKGFRSINMDTIRKIKIDGQVYKL